MATLASTARAPEALAAPAARQRLRQTGRYLAQRLAVYALTLWGAYTLSFLFFRLMPGDPVQAFISNLATKGEYIDAEAATEQSRLVAQTLSREGNLLEQYVRYFGRLSQGDFGASFLNFPHPAIVLVLRALPWTGCLLLVSVLIAWTLGLFLGAISGWKRDRPWAQALAAFAIAFGQVPFYFLALFLLIVLAYGLGLFPIRGGFGSTIRPGLNLEFVVSAIRHAILPATALLMISACQWLISTRALMVSVLGEDFLLYAEAKGLARRTILYRYALRNVMLPQITHLAISLGFVINGAILLEQLFVYPGVGLLLLYSLRDSLLIGGLAGLIATSLGIVIGFTAGYKSGRVDSFLRSLTDMVLVIPTLPLLIILGAILRVVDIVAMAVLLSAFGWAGAARAIRAQVLSLRERPYVELAQLNDEGDAEIIFTELVPNLLPYLGVGLASSVVGAILAETGLELIGFGPGTISTLGSMIYQAMAAGMISQGRYDAVAVPAGTLVILFLGLNLINMGLEETYNPRLRRLTAD